MKYRKLSEPSDGVYYAESRTLVAPALGPKFFVLRDPLLVVPGAPITATAIDVPGVVIYSTAVSLVGTLLQVSVTSFTSATSAEVWAITSQQPMGLGDMLFGHGDGNFLQDSPDVVAQAVGTRLKLWSGEWFLDSAEGTPYLLGVFRNGGRQQLEPIMRDRIRATQGVLAITSLSTFSDPDARTASVSADLETIYGAAALKVTP